MKRVTFFITLGFVLARAIWPISANASPLGSAPTLQGEPPIEVQITGLQYDPQEDHYSVALSMSGTSRIQQLILTIEDVEAGTEAQRHFINPAGRFTVQVEFDATNLRAGRKYLLTVNALNLQGNMVERPDDNLGSDSDERHILASKEFVYEPPVLPTPEFSIESVNAEYQNDRLVIMLGNVPPEAEVLAYDGFVVDEGGQRILDFGPTLFAGPRIETPLPSAMRVPGEAREYRVTVNLRSRDEAVTSALFEGFKPNPPTPPSRLQRIGAALTDNPVIPASILIIVLSIVTWRLLVNQKGSKRFSLQRPPIEYTRQITPMPPRMRVRMRVVESPGVLPGTEKMIATFPCVIGRQDFPGDTKVSRRHASMSVRNNELFITDLGSTNGTFIGGVALKPDAPTRLAGNTLIRFGMHTYCELDLEV
jgi:hypothetical protein